jgi:O-antigen ligase
VTVPRPVSWAVGALLVCALALPYVGGPALALITAVLILGLSVWHLAQRWRPSFDPGAAMLLVSFVLLFICFVLTNRPGKLDVAFALNFTLFVLYAPLVGLLSRLASPGNVRRVAWISLAGAGLAFCYAVTQFAVFDVGRPSGFGSSPISSATVALFLGFIAPLGYLVEPSSRRYWFLAGPLLGVATVMLSGSRGPMLAIPVLALIAIVMVPVRRTVLAVIVVGALVVGGAYLANNPDALGRIMVVAEAASQVVSGDTVDADKSTGIRARIYASSFAAFRDSPWIGHGWGGMVPAVVEYLPGVFTVNRHAQLHSDIWNFAVAAGVVGLLAYGLAVFAPIASVLASPRDSQFRGRLYGVLVLCSGYIVCGTVNMLLGFEYLTTFFIATAAILTGYCRDAPAGSLAPKEAAR